MFIFPKFKYPKMVLLLLSYLLAYVLFKNRLFFTGLESLGYLGTFVAGIMYSYGFTAGPATAFFLIFAKSQDFLIAGFIAGMGSLLGDLLIFEFIRTTFLDELFELSHERVILKLEGFIPKRILPFILPITAAFVISSPLPDEIGVSLLAAGKIRLSYFSILSFCLNTLGIIVIIHTGQLI